MKKPKTKISLPVKPPSPIRKTGKQFWEKRYAITGALLIVCLLGIVIYSDSFACSFHFDDFPNLVDNKKIQNPWDLGELWSFNHNRFVAFYTFALNYHFNELDVWGYHFVNLVVHLFNSCLVNWITLLIFSCPALKENPVTKHKNAIAFVTALLFVSHPLATQSVTYIVQRLASLVALFYLLSLALFVKGRLARSNTTSQYLFFAGSGVSAVLALFTKENAFTLPLAIVLFEIFFLQTKRPSVNFKDRRIYLLLAVLTGSAALVVLRFPPGIFRPIPPSVGNAYTVTPLNYLFTQFSVIVKYIQLLFLPLDQNLEYDFPLSNSFFEPRTLLSFLLLLSLLVLAILLFKKNRVLSFGIAWFFLTLAVESGMVPIKDVIFEHRTYLPSFGFFLFLSYLLFGFLWGKFKVLAIVAILAITGSYALLTYQRNKAWEDDLTLLNDIISKSPHKARPYNNRGILYMNNNNIPEALNDFNKAIEFNKGYADAFNNRGALYSSQNKYDQALADLNKAIELDSNFAKAYVNRGIVFMNTNQLEQALNDYSRAIALQPGLPDAYVNRGNILRDGNRNDEALRDYNKAIALQPDHAIAYFNRATLFMNEKKNTEALADLNKAIQLDPGYTKAYFNRGNFHYNNKNYDEAITDYSKAIELNRGFARAYYQRGMAEYNSGKKDAACADLKQSAALGYEPGDAARVQLCK